MQIRILLVSCLSLAFSVAAQNSDATLRASVRAKVDAEYPSLFQLYTNLHAHPELSLCEAKTSARVADELKHAGYVVTTDVGGYGVVAVLKIKDQTGLPYASHVTTKDEVGNDVPVMHACGHDVHMICLIGVARVLSQLQDRWHGTLVLISQPAEERGAGARAMLKDGLFTRFPRPNFCLALHDSAEFPAGTVAYTPGYAGANVDSVDIIVRGMGGHGAYPHKTKDPIVLASQIVLALQTIVSREIKPGEPAVVTVGSIHGGTKHNIIPDEVKLQLTVRSYTDEVRKQTLNAIQRIARGEGIAAGLPEDLLPIVKIDDDFNPALYNDPALTERLARVFKIWFGESNVVYRTPSVGGEDFAEYGRTNPRIPICMFDLGAVEPAAVEESRRTGKPLPSLHSPLFAPAPEPTLKTGVTAMTAAVLELMGGKQY